MPRRDYITWHDQVGTVLPEKSPPPKSFGIVEKAEEYLNSIFREVVSLPLMMCSASFSETDGVDLIVRLNEQSAQLMREKFLFAKS